MHNEDNPNEIKKILNTNHETDGVNSRPLTFRPLDISPDEDLLGGESSNPGGDPNSPFSDDEDEKTSTEFKYLEIINNIGTLPSDLKTFLRSKQLRPSHQAMLVHLLNGLDQGQIARLMGITQKTVSVLWRDKTFRSIYEALNAIRLNKATTNASKVRETLDKHSIKAAEFLALTMNDEDSEGEELGAPPSVRLSAATKILEMSGHKAPDRLKVEVEKPMVIRVQDDSYTPEDDQYYKKDVSEDEIEKELSDVDERLGEQ